MILLINDIASSHFTVMPYFTRTLKYGTWVWADG